MTPDQKMSSIVGDVYATAKSPSNKPGLTKQNINEQRSPAGDLAADLMAQLEKKH